jgi:hypothetical protein
MLARVAVNDDSQQAILANCRKSLHAMLPSARAGLIPFQQRLWCPGKPGKNLE